MNSPIHIRLMTKIATAFAVVAVAAPVAAAGGHGITYSEPGSTGYVSTNVSIPSNLKTFREPGSTGYVATKVSIPANLRNFHEPGSVGWVPSAAAVAAATTAGTDGLDWASALIGGGVVLGIGLVSAGAVLAMRRRRGLAHA